VDAAHATDYVKTLRHLGTKAAATFTIGSETDELIQFFRADELVNNNYGTLNAGSCLLNLFCVNTELGSTSCAATDSYDI